MPIAIEWNDGTCGLRKFIYILCKKLLLIRYMYMYTLCKSITCSLYCRVADHYW